MMESLLKTHPFVDGNKRVAFFFADVFLRLNGIQLVIQAKPAEIFILNFLSPPPKSRDTLTQWLHNHIKDV